jgi:hypothetical protein
MHRSKQHRHSSSTSASRDAGTVRPRGFGGLEVNDWSPDGHGKTKDGTTVGIAGEVAQNFLGSPEGSFAINHPLTVAQRRQIGREDSRICQRSVLVGTK